MADGARRRSALGWNAEGWFRGQIGSTLWPSLLGAPGLMQVLFLVERSARRGTVSRQG